MFAETEMITESYIIECNSIQQPSHYFFFCKVIISIFFETVGTVMGQFHYIFIIVVIVGGGVVLDSIPGSVFCFSSWLDKDKQ